MVIYKEKPYLYFRITWTTQQNKFFMLCPINSVKWLIINNL